MGDFVVAEDIAGRLKELRHHLGEAQRPFAARFCRGWKQVSEWERGNQRPRPSVLRQAATQHGWPVEIFAAGGPRPRVAVNATAPVIPVAPPTMAAAVRKEQQAAVTILDQHRADGVVPAAVVLGIIGRLTEPVLSPDLYFRRAAGGGGDDDQRGRGFG